MKEYIYIYIYKRNIVHNDKIDDNDDDKFFLL